MSVTAPPVAPVASRGADGTTRGGRYGRLRRWRSGWAVALRMARREVRRHAGRSLLIVLMVGLPLALISATMTLSASQQITAIEALPFSLGTSQAFFTGPYESRIQQDAAGSYGVGWGDNDPATAIPGWSAESTIAEQEAALTALVGSLVRAETLEPVRWPVADRMPFGTAMHLDLDVDRGAKVELTSGRMPEASDEVLVTELGLERGLPAAGPVELQMGDQTVPVVVVGTASAYSTSTEIPDLVTDEGPWNAEGELSTTWLVDGPTPVTADDVLRLNDFGMAVDSRAVLTDPAQRDALEAAGGFSSPESLPLGYAVALGTMLLVVVVLLVAPAFTVSARRQRRTLAIGASNGAPAAVLRRWVLAQALVLGWISAVVGTALGVLAAVLALRAGLVSNPRRLAGVLEIPWLALAVVAGFGVLAALVAALLPAARLGRLDIVGVIRGQSVSAPLRRWPAVLGAGLFVVSAALLVIGRVADDWRTPAGIVGLFLGALLLVPALLVRIGGRAARLPAPWRMATRDAARHRGRAVPTVAAVLAGVAVVTTYQVAVASDTAHRAANYAPWVPMGEAQAQVFEDAQRTMALDALERQAPHLVPVQLYGLEEPSSPGASQQDYTLFVDPACPVGDTVDVVSLEVTCRGFVAGAPFVGHHVEVWPAEEMVRRFRLDAETAEQVRSGTAVVMGSPDLTRLTVVTGTMGSTALGVAGLRELPDLAVVHADPGWETDGRWLDQGVGVMLPLEKAQEMDLPVFPARVHVYDPAGPIDEQTELRVDESLEYPEMFYVERGFQRSDEAFLLPVAIGGLALLTIVTLISTALALAEQRADSATLAAVGATRGTRRKLAAVQAAVTGAVGSALGAIVGGTIGVALALRMTGLTTAVDGVEGLQTPTIDVPWGPVALVVLGVPVMAALLAALAVHRAPRVDRRTT